MMWACVVVYRCNTPDIIFMSDVQPAPDITHTMSSNINCMLYSRQEKFSIRPHSFSYFHIMVPLLGLRGSSHVTFGKLCCNPDSFTSE